MGHFVDAQERNLGLVWLNVIATDDQTIQWQVTTPGPAVLDAIVRSTAPRPYSQYGKWMDAAARSARRRRSRWR